MLGLSKYCCHFASWEPVTIEPVSRFRSKTVRQGERFEEVYVFLSNQYDQFDNDLIVG